MTRLPSHCEVPWLPENATAQTVPSLATSVPHMWKPRPPLAPAVGVMAPTSAERSCENSGRAEQSAKAGTATMVTRALIEHKRIRRLTFIVLLLRCDGWWMKSKRRSHRACAKSEKRAAILATSWNEKSDRQPAGVTKARGFRELRTTAALEGKSRRNLFLGRLHDSNH